MKKIRNRYHSDLTFPDFDLHLFAGETKVVEDSVFERLVYSPWIEEVKETPKVETKVEEKINKIENN